MRLRRRRPAPTFELRELVLACLAADRRDYVDGRTDLPTYRRMLRLHRGMLHDLDAGRRLEA